MSDIERCARALHRRDVDDPACEPDRREWDHLAVALQDEYRADARAVLDAANHQGAVSLAAEVEEAIRVLGESSPDNYGRVTFDARTRLQAALDAFRGGQ